MEETDKAIRLLDFALDPRCPGHYVTWNKDGNMVKRSAEPCILHD